jgi:hypothetical protein
MEEKFSGIYNFVAVAKNRCSGECAGSTAAKDGASAGAHFIAQSPK